MREGWGRNEVFESWREDRGRKKEGMNIKGGTEIVNLVLV
jgi:hypothetical protein